LVRRDLDVCEAHAGGLVIVLDVGETHPSVGFRGDQKQFLVWALLLPTSASSIWTEGPSGSLSERTIAARSLCNQDHAVL
jgi:hypothetical protein